MEALPPEIIDQILETFPHEHGPDTGSRLNRQYRRELARYSTISRSWKASTERLIYQSLLVGTDELDDCAALFNGANISRRAALSALTVIFILPDPENAMGCCAVTRVLDRRADGAAFSAALAKTFTILKDLNARACGDPPLSLVFHEGWRVSRNTEPYGWSRVPCLPERKQYGVTQHSRRELLAAQATSGQFEIVCRDTIPRVHGVKTLEHLGNDELEALRPSWIPELVQKLPNLEKLSVRSADKYEHGRLHRRAQRECFSSSIQNVSGQNLKELVLDTAHDEMQNEHSAVHEIVDVGDWNHESHFTILGHVSTFSNLTVLRLLGGLVVCPEFFRGIVDHPGTPFPALIEFEFQFAPETPDGRWFFQRDSDAIEKSRFDTEFAGIWEELERRREQTEAEFDDDSESADSDEHVRVYDDEPFRTDVVPQDRFRSLPDTTTFLLFLLDASKSVLRMPSLRKFIMKLGNREVKHSTLNYFPIVTRVFELWYLRPSMPRSPHYPKGPNWRYNFPMVPGDAAYVNQSRLYWRVDQWKPWDEASAAWV